ncbi:hypothetical protein CRG98_016538 [Punica granatum]|uniref:Uncharacterized protein n=1 Tax=Punica granatum TaxID=22663 RepID=A0A2I0K3F9_PUNGR|nr:hypothetical protein CRG98_016538 [Punica granatum]
MDEAAMGVAVGPTDRVDPRLFSQNDHCTHLRGSVRSQEPLALPQNSIGRYRADVRPENCLVGSVFQTYSIFGDIYRAIWVNPIGLEPNDHHSHLRGSLRSRKPLALPQNSIGRHRGDVRPEKLPNRVETASSRVCFAIQSVQAKTAQNRPTNGPTRLFTVPSRIPKLGITIPDLEVQGLLHFRCDYGVIRGFYACFTSKF